MALAWEPFYNLHFIVIECIQMEMESTTLTATAATGYRWTPFSLKQIERAFHKNENEIY